MATVLKQNLYDTIVSVLTTELNTLTNASFAISSARGSDATTPAALFGDWELVLASLNPTGTPTVELYQIRSADGTNYDDPNAASQPSIGTFSGSFELTTGAAAKRKVLADVPEPPGLSKAIVKNNSGVTFAGTLNTVKVRPHNLQNV